LRHHILIGLVLAAVTVAVYAPTFRHEFITFDDRGYVSENPRMDEVARNGFTWSAVTWAFSTDTQGNWHPLTWLSHMADSRLFGTAAAGRHHMVSVLIHILSTVLLFVVLTRATGSVWRSAVVAALFALHPLHVESVAWASERKDVLSGLFFVLTLAAYIRYAARPSAVRYLLVAAMLALGLMAKPMLVTVPLVLLLVDVWPLRRISWGKPLPPGATGGLPARAGRLVLEKLPLLALAAGAAVMTVIAQRSAGAVAATAILPVGQRVANALVSYAVYIEKMFWPAGLSFFYPYPLEVPVWQWVGAAAGLILVTVLVIVYARRAPYLAVGWFWFLGMLVPVIGLVQVGEQSMADRYTYLPLIGLFIAGVWGAADLIASLRLSRPAVVAGALAAVVLVGCIIATARQVGYWRDSVELYTHALELDPQNHVAAIHLGYVFLNAGDLDAAAAEFEAAAKARSSSSDAFSNLAATRLRQGRLSEAETAARHARDLEPLSAQACHNLGVVLAAQGRWADAEEPLRAAVNLKPEFPAAQNDLGKVLLSQGKADEAVEHLRKALEDQPVYAMAWRNLAQALLTRGRHGDLVEAERAARNALGIEPQNPRNQQVLQQVLEATKAK
jgi:protein O-mannosyl-transferase